MSEKISVILGIEIEGQRILLSEDAAKQLYEKLRDIFENKVAITYVPWIYPQYIPQPIWVNPYWWNSPNIVGSGTTTIAGNYNPDTTSSIITCYSVNS